MVIFSVGIMLEVCLKFAFFQTTVASYCSLNARVAVEPINEFLIFILTTVG